MALFDLFRRRSKHKRRSSDIECDCPELCPLVRIDFALNGPKWNNWAALREANPNMQLRTAWPAGKPAHFAVYECQLRIARAVQALTTGTKDT